MPTISIPQARRIVLDPTGAQIVTEESPALRDSRGIYLPHYIEPVSHIAIDIGGSLAKVVYFTRSNKLPRARRSGPHAGPSEDGTAREGEEVFVPVPGTRRRSSGRNGTKDGGDYKGDGAGEGEGGLRGAHGAEGDEDGRRHGDYEYDYDHPPLPTANGALTPSLLSTMHNTFPPSPNPNDVGPPSPFVQSPSSPAQPGPGPSARDPTRARPLSSTHTSTATSAPTPTLPSRRYSMTQPLPGGLLNFARFETSSLALLIQYINDLISLSATFHQVSVARMKAMVKIMATGGGAHMYYDELVRELGVEVRREDEMECLVLGLGFLSRVPEEVFWFSEELVYKVSHSRDAQGQSQPNQEEFARPSPSPPQYGVTFAPTPEADAPNPHFPCLVVNIGSGVSIVKVDAEGGYERVSGTSLGGGTLWGLLSLLTDAESFDEMLALSEKGDNAAVDMLVGDIYGSDYNKIGLKSSTIASTFGKVFKRDNGKNRSDRASKFRQEDIARSLLYAISNNIGHVAYMNADKYSLDRVIFSGAFIRQHAATIATLSYAIRFWSKGKMRATFLRHEGYLGSLGAWIKNVNAAVEAGAGAGTRGTNGEVGASGAEQADPGDSGQMGL